MGDRRDRMSPGSGKLYNAAGGVVDVAAILETVYDATGGAIKTSGGGSGATEVDANLQVGDAAVANANPVPVSDAGGSLTVDGTVAVTDGGGSLTVDGTVAVSGTVATAEATKTLVALSGTCASAGANTLVAAPGEGYRLVICGLTIQNEVATEQTAQAHEESTATKGVRLFAPADAAGWGIKREYALGREWRLAENKGLIATLSAATTVGFSVLYFTEAV